MKPFEENVLFDVTEAQSWINMSSVFHFNSLFQKYLLCVKKSFYPFKSFGQPGKIQTILTSIYKSTFSAKLSCSYMILITTYMNFFNSCKKIVILLFSCWFLNRINRKINKDLQFRKNLINLRRFLKLCIINMKKKLRQRHLEACYHKKYFERTSSVLRK